MKKGDIVLASLPMSNGAYKERPTLVITFFPPYNDCLVCGISSQLHQNLEETGYSISENKNYFSTTGLRKSSVVRLNYLVVLPEDIIAGKIGSIPENLYSKIVDKLITLIKK